MIKEKIFNYFERNPRLKVLFIFENMSFISEEIRDANIDWPEDFVYFIFDGAWFNLKYNIEYTWKDKKVVLLFPEGTVPYSEQEQLRFPLMDVLRANMEFKGDDYASFIQQYGLPEKFTSFVKRNIALLQSSKIQNILSEYLNKESFSEDVVIRALLTSYLGEKRLLDWESIIVKMLIMDLDHKSKKHQDFYRKVSDSFDVKTALNSKLNHIFGQSFNPHSPRKMENVAASLKYNAITQSLSVEAADDYKIYKVSDPVSLVMLNRVYDFGSKDRQLSEKFQEALNELAANIIEERIIQVYGVDASYYNYTERLSWPILEQLLSEKLLATQEDISDKIRDIRHKLPEIEEIKLVVDFISNQTLFYDKYKGVGSMKLNTPNEYIDLYTSGLYLLDTYYRRSLDAYHLLLSKQIPVIASVENRKRKLDHDYASVTNLINLEWLNCISDLGGNFDKVSLPRQEDFYNNEISKKGGNSKIVVIVSDALRYEVAAELLEKLSSSRHTATLSATLGILPTETAFGKRVLFPYSTLTFDGENVLNDGINLSDLKIRSNYLSTFKPNSICVNYAEVMNSSQDVNRELFKHPLVYIFHNTIDDAGHSQNPFDVIHACSRSIDQLKELLLKLHANWGVSYVLLTSDHGFLYNDIAFEEKDKVKIQEPTLERQAKTRYYLTYSPEDIYGVKKFDLTQVSKIKTEKPVYVAVPRGTNRFAAAGGYNFAHGGASLQEMLVPVVISRLGRTEKTDKVGVAILNTQLIMVSSLLRFNLVQKEAISMDKVQRQIVCCIYDGDDPVSEDYTVTLNSTDANDSQNRQYNIALRLNKPTSSNRLQLRVYDTDDVNRINPIIKETVINQTLIEQDF